jgi:hypothetical protein
VLELRRDSKPTPRLQVVFVALLFILATLAGCGSGVGSGPTGSTPAPPTAYSLDFTITPMAASQVSVVGASILDLGAIGNPTGSYSRGGRLRGFPATPAESAPSRTLADLDRAGEFVKALVPTPHFVQGTLGTGVQRQGQAQIPVASDQRFRFSRGEKSCVVFVTWTPAQKQDSTAAFELFDEDNRRVGASDPAQVKLRPNSSFVHYWTVNLNALVPGVYRVDVKLGSDPVWRTFFRVTD